MENSGLKLDVLHWERTLTHPVVAAILLATLCLGLHHSALSGGWRYDDGPHLYFTALYSPWQYFFVPEIMREQSWAHITPWNALFYEIGLSLFGLNPAGHYAHLLFILWLTSVATFYLLRLWLVPLSALMGAALFLAMPATGAIGQMLMTGHYAYGLFFSVLTFYFFARGVREGRISFSLLAAGFYAAACLSKELYVPIIAILIFFPENDWKTRFRHAWLAILVALVYAVYRIVVLEGIGGYGNPPLASTLTIIDILAGLISSLFGSEWSGKLVVTYICISALIAIFIRKKQFNLFLLTAGFVVVFIPILPMLQTGFIDSKSSRLLFFVSWTLTVLLVWLANPSRLHAMTLLIVIAALVFSQQKIAIQITNMAKVMEEQNRFLIEEKGDKVLLPFHFARLGYLDSMQKASIILGREDPPAFLRDEEELKELGEKAGSEVYQFNDQCQCILQMGKARYRDHINNFRSRLAAGADYFLSVLLEIEDRGVRKLLRWKFSGTDGNFNFYIREYDMIPLPPSGELSFGLDITGPPKQDLHVYVHLTSPEGWIVRSPPLRINPTITNQVTWSGKSTIDWSPQEWEN